MDYVLVEETPISEVLQEFLQPAAQATSQQRRQTSQPFSKTETQQIGQLARMGVAQVLDRICELCQGVFVQLLETSFYEVCQSYFLYTSWSPILQEGP